jgi:16S rRNA processing protein RimM
VAEAAQDEGIVAGRVGRPHGLDGSFHVVMPIPALLTLGASVTIEGSTVEIVRRAGTDDRPIVRLSGATERGHAEAMRGKALFVPRDRAPALGEGEWWAHDLEGCQVTDGERSVGRVRRMIALPSCEALEVEREEGGDLLVPLVRDAVRDIDPAAGRIDVDMTFVEGPPA